jgi:predicted nucleic acid-binding protein
MCGPQIHDPNYLSDLLSGKYDKIRGGQEARLELERQLEVVKTSEVTVLEKTYGVAQGNPVSCSTATLALKSLERKYKNIVIYADDLLIFSDKEIDLEHLANPEIGLVIHPTKSGYVKHSGS